MKTNKFKRAIVMLLAITMLLTSTGMASFAESMGEGADKVSTEAVATESGSDAVQAAAEEAAAEISDEEVPEAAPAESAEPAKDSAPKADEAKAALTAKDWEAGLPDDISKDVREAMAQVAKSQLKAEGDLYKAFANAESLDNWDASFVMFVLEYANVLGVSKAIGDESKGTVDKDNISVPVNADTDKWIKALKDKDLFKEISDEAAPEQGDIVFVKNGGDTEAAVVLDTDENEVTVIGAYINNVGKYVADTDKVLGFVSLKDIAPEAIKEEAVEEEQVEEPTDENAEAADDADKEDAEELTEEELAAKKTEEEAAAKAAEEAAKAEEAGLTDQTLTAELVSAPGFGGKLRGFFTSNKGTEITLSGYMPEGAVAKAYPVNVEIPGQSVLAAYDITIYVTDEDGNEVVWQPETPLNVSIKAKAIPESAEELSVFHMENKKADPEQIGTVSAAAKSVEFEADSFSIYVVTQDADTVTYRFVENTDKDGDTWTGEYTQLRQILENGDKLVKPTAPTKEGSVFDGWYEYDPDSQSVSETEFTDWTTVTVPQHAEGQQPTRDEKILVAKFSNEKVKVTYYDQNESIVQIQEVATGTTINPNDKDGDNFVDYVPIQNQEGSYLLFEYWTDQPYGNQQEVEEITVNSDIGLYPVLGEAHYIYFDNNDNAINGAKASYVHSIQVTPGARPAGGSSIVPTAPGHEFLGWYIKSDNTANADKYKVFNADGSLNNTGWNSLMTKSGGTDLTYDPTLYAHWTTGQSSYTVAYYAQKSTCVAGQTPVADDDYEFVKADTTARSANTGDSVNRSVLGNETTILNTAFDATTSNTWQKDRIGFKLSDDNNPDYIVNGDGSTVLKVYLDRRTYTMTFNYDKGEVTGSNTSQTRNDSITFADGVTADTIVALYGQSIKGKFPVKLTQSKRTRRTAISTWGNWTATTYDASSWRDISPSPYFAEVFAATDTMPPQNVSVQLGRTMESTKTAVYYLELADYSDPDFNTSTTVRINNTTIKKYDEVDGRKYVLDRYLIHDFNFLTMGEEFYDIEGFAQGYADPAFSQTTDEGVPRTPQLNNGDVCKLYYDRNEPVINLVDPKDSTQNRSETFKFGESIKADDNRLRKFIPGENIEELDKDYYWFYDEECKNPVDFDNLQMPNHQMTFYAGLKKSYFVEIYPDGGELGGNVNTYSTWFRLDEGETINPYENVSRDYIKVDSAPEDGSIDTYWYDAHYANEQDADNRYAVYQPMDPEHQDRDIYVKSPGVYSFVGWFLVPSNVEDPTTWTIPNGSAPYNFGDEITGTVRLKAKWQLMSAFSIVYDTGEHVHAPVDSNTYQEGANAIVKPSRSNPVGKQFRGWKVQGTTGPVYQPNGEILVSEDIATVNDDGTMTITLEAVYDEEAYKDNYTADYIFKVGDTEYYRQTLSPGEELVTPVAPSVPAGLPEGTSFTGWYEDSACTHKFSGFGAISNPVETTLYAGFAKQHTVTYYDAKNNGNEWVKGDNIIQVQKYNDGAELDTSKVIYEFDSNRYVSKWNVENGSAHQVDYKKSHTGYFVSSDLTVWPAMQDYLLLQYDSRGGSYVEPAKIPTDGRSWPNRPVEPTRDGYKFLGWFTSPDQIYDEDGHVNPSAGNEYDFDRVLPAGTTTLYAWWEPVGGKNTAEYTVIWWAQAASGDKTYEFQKSQKFTGKIGSRVDLTTSAWETENGFDPTDVANLVQYYDSNTANDKSKYFEFAGIDAAAAAAVNIDPSEVSDVIHDDGSTVLNLRFNRKRFWVAFDTDGKGEVRYKTETYSSTSTDPDKKYYFIEAWLDRQVSDIWPAYNKEREEDPNYNKALVLVSSGTYLRWHPEPPVPNAGTIMVTITAQMLNAATTSVGGKDNVLRYKLETSSDTTVVHLHYFKDGVEDDALSQEIKNNNVSSGINYPDDNTYKYNKTYSAKELTGYSIIADSEHRNPKATEYQGKYAGYGVPDSSKVYPQYLTGSVETKVNRYYYTRKNPNRHYYRREVILFIPYYDELTVNIGGSGNQYDVGLKDGNTNYTGTIYYRDGNSGSYQSMSFDEFKVNEFNEEIVEETITTDDPNAKHVFFFYSKNSYEVILMNADGTSEKERISVPYNDLVSTKLVGHDPTTTTEGISFTGWSVSPDAYAPFTSLMPARPIVLYQIWEPTRVRVTTQGYDQNGDPITEGGEEGVYEANYNSMLRQFGVRDPKSNQQGVAFGGWEKKVVKDGETKWEPIPLSERLKDDTIIRPVWKNMHAANVTYVLNGGTGSVDGTEAVEGETGHFVDSSSYLLGSKAEIKSGAALTKTEGTGDDAVDYSFVCWNTNADGSGEDYYAGDSIALSKHGITLYARYVAKRKVTLVYDLNTTDTNAKFYDLNATTGKYTEAENQSKQYLLIDSGDSDSAAGKINKVYEAGKEINDSKADTALVKFLPARPGYTFKGWSRNSAGPADVKDGASIRVNTLENNEKTDTLYAIWEEQRLPIEVYEDSTIKNADKDGYHLTTATTAALTPEAVEQSYRTQLNAYTITEGYEYDNAMVGTSEIDKLQYVFNDTTGSYEWQYHKTDTAANTFDVVGAGPVKVTFSNGELTITKTVTGDFADTTQEFEFTLTAVEGAQTGATFKLVKGTASPVNIAIGGTFKLKNGESVKIKLPRGKNITITETAVNGYTAAFACGTGTESVSGTANSQTLKLTASKGTLGVTNTAATGDLTVSKTVNSTISGMPVDEDQVFTFTLVSVAGASADTEFTLKKGTSAAVKIKQNETFTLKHSESAVITLPQYKDVVITETPVNGYTAAFACGTGTTPVEGTVTNGKKFQVTAATGSLAVTNTLATGNLTVSKTVDGLCADENQAFTFKLTSVEDASAATEFDIQKGEAAATKIKVGETFTLKHGENAVITLPQYKDVTITETAVDGYTTAFTCGDGTAAVEGTVTNGQKLQLTAATGALGVKNTLQSGKLTVNKTVVGQCADENQDFTFTLTDVEGASNTTEFNIQKGEAAATKIKVGETFTLKHGESAEITLPQYKNVTITETAENGYVSTFACGTGTTPAEETVTNGKKLKLTADEGTLTAMNTLQSGALTVTKTVDGLCADENQDFTFTLTDVEGASDTTEFDIQKGEAAATKIKIGETFTLKHNESAVITLPQYKDVTITETPVDGYTTAFTCGDGTAAAEGTVTNGQKLQLTAATGALGVKNTLQSGDLTVTKTVSGTYADQDKVFTFKLEAVEGAPEGQKFTITRGEGQGISQIGIGGTFTLKHGESQIITLPQYRDVTITEVPDGYDAAFNCGTGTEAATGDDAAVENGKKFHLTAEEGSLGVTNSLGDSVLTITKEVTGEYGDQTRPFVFTLADVEDAAEGDTYTIVKGQTSSTIAVGGTFTLKHGEEAKITLPRNKKIKITEEQVDGYTATFTPGAGTSDEGAVTTGEDEAAVTIGKKVKLTAAEGSLAVVNGFKNDSVVPTGIAKSNMILIPLFLSLILALGIILSIIQRRRLASRTR